MYVKRRQLQRSNISRRQDVHSAHRPNSVVISLDIRRMRQSLLPRSEVGSLRTPRRYTTPALVTKMMTSRNTKPAYLSSCQQRYILRWQLLRRYASTPRPVRCAEYRRRVLDSPSEDRAKPAGDVESQGYTGRPIPVWLNEWRGPTAVQKGLECFMKRP